MRAILVALLIALTFVPTADASGCSASVRGICVSEPPCADVVWLDERVGPVHVFASGCTASVSVD